MALAVAINRLSVHAQLRKAMRTFRTMQRIASLRIEYREASPADAALFTRIPDAVTSEARRLMTHLGDAVGSNGESTSGFRVFIDETRTTLVYVYSDHIGAESYTDTLELATSAAQPLLAQPDFARQQTLAAPPSIAELLAAHQEWIRGATREPFLSFATLADAVRAWEEVRDRKAAWRGAQEPEHLMKEDLRVWVGQHMEAAWERFGDELRAELPEARLRSRPRSS